MADTKLSIFQSDATTAAIDYRTESTNGDGRQVIVIGDPSSNNAVASVQATDPSSNTEGVVVRDVNTSAIVSRLGSTLFVQLDPGHLLGSVTANAGSGTFTVAFDPGHELGSIKGSNSSIAVFFDRGNPSVNINSQTATINVALDPGHLLGSVTANAGTGSFNVQFDPGHTLGKIEPGVGTFQVYLPDTGHELGSIKQINSSVAVFFDRANPNVLANAGTGSFNVQFDPGHTLGKVEPGAGTFQVYLPDTGHELGSIRGINNSINVYLGATAGTLIVKPDPAGTYFVNAAHTASIFTVSGSTSGISVSGVNLVAPSASYNYKVFAYSIQTTGIVSVTPKFVNGSGASQTEFWRPLATANQTSSTPIGANMAVVPPGFIFATGTNTSLNLLLDTGTLVHYSVSYIKESA